MTLLFATLSLLSAQPVNAIGISSERAPGADPGTLPCLDRRTLFGITWGCFSTLFACVWVSAHPNVPPPAREPPGKHASLWEHIKWYAVGQTTGLRRRLGLVLTAFIAPELIVGFAGRQLETAMYFSKRYGISITHGFFISMGGFVDEARHPIAQSRDVEDHYRAICHVSEQDIVDRSQGDAFAKTVALLQALWFVVQCLARLHQGLPLTELEVATLGFATVNAFTWELWWHKPLDVRAPIFLPSPDTSARLSRPREWGTHRPLPAPSLGQRFMWVLGYSSTRDHFYDAAVPSFYFASDAVGDDHERYTPMLQMLVALLFSAVHCAAWNARFLSVVEMWLWRGAAVLLGIVPVVVLLVYGHGVAWHCDGMPYIGSSLSLYVIGALIYVPVRAVLVVLPLLALRALPDGAYVDVNWSRYLPHVFVRRTIILLEPKGGAGMAVKVGK
ncbi:hypothetical protein MIND_01426800 [Mycena indigotica]|uniref:Wax synthase domain-containing protein n=1 Tax=Mycena indigotica TaxID=2126181 RepID=A0A8H6VNT2_9AGAR|nr:uncharacterized protein MIND_01426800 [Mycena indigotica]KAF7288602.1 hypothetical protein MIND_01426800 [Mycena indigotica]